MAIDRRTFTACLARVAAGGVGPRAFAAGVPHRFSASRTGIRCSRLPVRHNAFIGLRAQTGRGLVPIV